MGHLLVIIMSCDEEINFRLSLWLTPELHYNTVKNPADIARYLRETADRIEEIPTLWSMAHYQTIHDDRNNTIGDFAVKNQDGNTPNMSNLEKIQGVS